MTLITIREGDNKANYSCSRAHPLDLLALIAMREGEGKSFHLATIISSRNENI